MTRCAICHRRLWPWQSRGWLTFATHRVSWHPQCYWEFGYIDG